LNDPPRGKGKTGIFKQFQTGQNAPRRAARAVAALPAGFCNILKYIAKNNHSPAAIMAGLGFRRSFIVQIGCGILRRQIDTPLSIAAEGRLQP